MNKLNYTKITIDNRCLDLLLTEDEITTAFERSLLDENKSFMNWDECCKCWPIQKPPECNFWRKILGLCIRCNCPQNHPS